MAPSDARKTLRRTPSDRPVRDPPGPLRRDARPPPRRTRHRPPPARPPAGCPSIRRTCSIARARHADRQRNEPLAARYPARAHPTQSPTGLRAPPGPAPGCGTRAATPPAARERRPRFGVLQVVPPLDPLVQQGPRLPGSDRRGIESLCAGRRDKHRKNRGNGLQGTPFRCPGHRLTFRARNRPETEAMVNGGRTTRKVPFPRLPCTVGFSGIGFRGRIPGAVRSPPRPSLPLSRPALPIRAAAWLRRCKTLRHPNRSEWVPVRVNTRASSSTCQTNSQSGSIRHSQERAHSPDSRCARWRGSSGSPANSRSTTAHNLSRPLPRRRQRRRSLSNRLVTSSRMPQRWAAFIASRVSYSVRSSRS